MVIGHQHLHAQTVGLGNALDAGDAVVDSDEDVRLAGRALRGHARELGREPVTELEAVGHEVAHAGAKGAQRAHAHGAGGRAVAVVVGDDEQALFVAYGIGKQHGRIVRM